MESKLLPPAELSKQHLLEKIAILQSKLKELAAKKISLVSALSIEKLHNRQFEESNNRLKQENSYLKGLLGENLPQELPLFPLKADPEPRMQEKLEEISSESYEFLDLDQSREEMVKNEILTQRKREYDVRIKCNSLMDFESGSCTVKSRLNGQDFSQRKSLILAAFGGSKMGKSYIINQICGFDFQADFAEKCQSQGVLLRYPKASSQLGFLDLYGTHLSIGEMNLTDHLRKIEDRILIKSFLEEFLLEICDAMIIVLSALSFEDEVLVEKIRRAYYGKKQIFVVHNFKSIGDPDLIEKRMVIDMKREGGSRECLKHVIYAKENSAAGEKFNKKGLDSLRKVLLENQRFRQFDLVREFRDFFKKNAERYLFPKGAALEERSFNEKLVLHLQIQAMNAQNPKKSLKMTKYDVFGNIIDKNRTPFYSVIQQKENRLKILIDLPGVCGYSVSLSNEFAVIDGLVFNLKTEVFRGTLIQEGEREFESLEWSLQVETDESLIKNRGEIKGHRLENGVLEIEVELF